MRSVQYGTRLIQYNTLEKQGLKSHYISVDQRLGVTLKGEPVEPEIAYKLILKKAKWIVNKLDTVCSVQKGDIVTGARLIYLGKTYYVEVISQNELSGVTLEFNYSKFRFFTGLRTTSQEMNEALEEFYKAKAVSKISTRVNRIAAKTKLPFKQLSFRKMNKRWGSCTADNRIIINTDAVKLPYTLIDYLITHELCHTVVKDHSKAYWAELSKHETKWRELDERLKDVKM